MVTGYDCLSELALVLFWPLLSFTTALVVPNYEHDKEIARDDVRARVHEKLDEVAGTLPFYKRVKALHLWDGELPRTATRKVKRKVVVDELIRLERAAKGARKAAASGGAGDWVLDVVAQYLGGER